jgi:hypothetical protein
MPEISSAENTAQVGLCGLLIQMTRVRGVTARTTASPEFDPPFGFAANLPV